MNEELARVLNGHLATRGWSFKKLAQAAGLPRNTVYRWTRGEVDEVRYWVDLVKAAQALELNRFHTNVLLEAGRNPLIDVLLERATDEEDRALLARWASTPPNNLPHHLTSFVGREFELEHITHVLSSVRLVTLTGSGGTGKTRLALKVAQGVMDEFEGAYIVELAPVRDPEAVILTISQTLGLRESLDEPPLSTLVANLRDRKVLLVLDNVEQVFEAGPLVAKLLEAAPRVKALVTSRTRLDVRGEHEVVVLPLPLPNLVASFEELSRNPAVILFVNRAVAANSSFTLTPTNAPLIAEVCARLDSLPLAIELAAARTRRVGVQAMLDRFPSRLALAGDGPRDVADRQRTLQATIAWSYDLLACNEQHLFRRLGVFAGGFTEDAARTVFAAFAGTDSMSARCGHNQPSPLLESLADQSLLQRNLDAGDEPRYEMLETIREYALERLEEHGELEAARMAHAGYYVKLAEQQSSPERDGQARRTQALARESDNVRMALAWSRDRGEQETGLRLCVALMPHWHLQDHQQEARTWLDTFMAASEQVSPTLRARGELWQGLQLLRGTGDIESASRHFDTALDLFHRHDDLVGLSEVKQAIGDVHRSREEWGQAKQRYVESRELAEQAGNAYLVAHGYMGVAFCAQEEDRFDDALRHWELTLEWTRRAGDQATEALALNSLGEMARHQGDWEAAERYYQQALNLAKELDSDFRQALALHNLGYVALARADTDLAISRFTKSLQLYMGQDYRKGVAECLAGLGKVEASAGRPERAACLCGASEAILEEMQTQLDTLDRADYAQTLAALRRQVGERLETLLGEGRAMSIDRAVRYAIQPQSASSQE